ncbi:MAG: DUF1840 domain-containing protein [Rugosibacter sp.]|jgi:hypothetical protein|nr:DUF1840 domain-containing protein [Rugosibacter sp.]MDO9273177.1 DUF1840 domain-containing protein [Rugosibacter sp.]
MIITFKSSAAGDVIMFSDVAHRLMQIMGKDATDKGILTVEQLPEAIRCLKAAIDEDKQRLAALPEEERPLKEKGASGERPFVSLYQRATPLLELIEWAQKKQKPVVWGV